MPLGRYNRNIIIDKVGEEGQKKLLNARVLVAGAGGLGSTVISNLAAMGIGYIGLVDNDVVELTNLNRQYIHKLDALGISKVVSAAKWVGAYNPDVQVETWQMKLDESNWRNVMDNYDVIVDCFDSYTSKFLLNNVALECGKVLIHGGVSEFFGQAMTIIGKKSACLKCALGTSDGENRAAPKGILSPTVTTIASIQAFETAKIILGIGKPLVNRLLTFDGLDMRFCEINISKNPGCVCSKACNRADSTAVAK